jgi:hypothetical protein
MQALFDLGSSGALLPLAVLACAPISSLSHLRRSSRSSTAAHHLESSAAISWPSGFDYSSMDFDSVFIHQHLICKVPIWLVAIACSATCC